MARAKNSADLHQRRSALPIIVAVAGDMQVQQAAAQVLVAKANQLSPRNYQVLAGHQHTGNMFFFSRTVCICKRAVAGRHSTFPDGLP